MRGIWSGEKSSLCNPEVPLVRIRKAPCCLEVRLSFVGILAQVINVMRCFRPDISNGKVSYGVEIVKVFSLISLQVLGASFYTWVTDDGRLMALLSIRGLVRTHLCRWLVSTYLCDASSAKDDHKGHHLSRMMFAGQTDDDRLCRATKKRGDGLCRYGLILFLSMRSGKREKGSVVRD